MLASIGVGFFIRAVLGLVYGHGQQVFQLPLVRPWRYFDVRIQPNDLKIGLTALATLAVVFLILHATPMGRRMRAVADDPMLARVSGIAPRKVMFGLWALGGAVAALAGVLLGIKTVVSPEMGWEMLIPVFAAAVLGGIGHPVGAVVAGCCWACCRRSPRPMWASPTSWRSPSSFCWWCCLCGPRPVRPGRGRSALMDAYLIAIAIIGAIYVLLALASTCNTA